MQQSKGVYKMRISLHFRAASTCFRGQCVFKKRAQLVEVHGTENCSSVEATAEVDNLLCFSLILTVCGLLHCSLSTCEALVLLLFARHAFFDSGGDCLLTLLLIHVFGLHFFLSLSRCLLLLSLLLLLLLQVGETLLLVDFSCSLSGGWLLL